jgi:hypothetical protein
VCCGRVRTASSSAYVPACMHCTALQCKSGQKYTLPCIGSHASRDRSTGWDPGSGAGTYPACSGPAVVMYTVCLYSMPCTPAFMIWHAIILGYSCLQFASLLFRSFSSDEIWTLLVSLSSFIHLPFQIQIDGFYCSWHCWDTHSLYMRFRSRLERNIVSKTQFWSLNFLKIFRNKWYMYIFIKLIFKINLFIYFSHL